MEVQGVLSGGKELLGRPSQGTLILAERSGSSYNQPAFALRRQETGRRVIKVEKVAPPKKEGVAQEVNSRGRIFGGGHSRKIKKTELLKKAINQKKRTPNQSLTRLLLLKHQQTQTWKPKAFMEAQGVHKDHYRRDVYASELFLRM